MRNLKQKELLFIVKTKQKEYRIYTNSEIEGFDEPIFIQNNFPSILGLELARQKSQLCESPPDKNNRSDNDGLIHSSPK